METQQVLKSNSLARVIGESILFKLAIIGFLTLLMLIPSNWVQDLILERQNRQNEVTTEISDKWSDRQLVEGPVLVLPYHNLVNEKDTAGRNHVKLEPTNIYILPEELKIASTANPEILHRGIFDAVVYSTKIKVNGRFSELELKKSGIQPERIDWNQAKVVIGLTDLKGLKNNPVIKVKDTSYNAEPDFTDIGLFSNTLIVVPDLSAGKSTALEFNFELDLRGSSDLTFQHLGKATTVTIDGQWDNPSFMGRYLPEKRNISKNGFSATWQLPYFNRTYPQQWVAQKTLLTPERPRESFAPQTRIDTSTASVSSDKNNTTFGVKFILPVDQYQKTMRSVKYSTLVILLTFVSLFFTELINKKKVHLLQYILIGAAMTIYYTLLLSFSEQVGFNFAYLIASLATILLIGGFILMLLKSKKPALVFAGILSVFYSFIYVIIQLQDLALLFGSVGLFIIISVLMYFSAKMDWSRKSDLESTE